MVSFSEGISKNLRIEWRKVLGLVILFLLSLAFIISYVVIEDKANDMLLEGTQICSTDSELYENMFTKISRQTTTNWIYNVSNPVEYLRNGADAQVHELGGYAYDLILTATDAQFSNEGQQLKFTSFIHTEFNADQSNSGLSPDDKISSMNLPYLTLLGKTKHEALFLLAMTCSKLQLGLLGNANFSACLPQEMGTSAICQCCSPFPSPNATMCSALVTPYGRAGGLISYLAQVDGGTQLSTNSSKFPLSTGSYTPLVVKKTVREVLLGTTSALLGLSAYTSGNHDAKAKIGNTTVDMTEACSGRGSCPTFKMLMAKIQEDPSKIISILQAIDCDVLIPNSAQLIIAGIKESRALELRYLEGVNCRPFSSTLAMAAFIKATPGAKHSCETGTLPCCLASFSIPPKMSGSGVGCLYWIQGALQNRQLYSAEEAKAYSPKSPENEFKTGCAPKGEQYQYISYQGNQELNRWFVPDSYEYPNMPWADPSESPLGDVPGTMKKENLTGTALLFRQGRGITSDYLDYELTDGNPLVKEEDSFDPSSLRTHRLSYRNAVEIDGLPTNRFEYLYEDSSDDGNRQMNGQMPYRHLNNLRYSKGVAGISSPPNFYGVNADILTQLSNLERGAERGGGVLLYKTRSSYKKGSSLLDSPEVMTEATLATTHEDLISEAFIEPASGLTVQARFHAMGSCFTWNCNPKLDPMCGFMASPYNVSNPLCYISGNGMHYPCGATNVFTPRVQGGKVIPIFRTHLDITVDTDMFFVLMNTRQALGVSALLLSIMFFVVLIVALVRFRTSSDDVKIAPVVIQSRVLVNPDEVTQLSSEGVDESA